MNYANLGLCLNAEGYLGLGNPGAFLGFFLILVVFFLPFFLGKRHE